MSNQSSGRMERVKHQLRTIAGVLILGLIILGPPVYTVYVALSGVPLYATRTVTTTTTQHYGLVPDVAPILLIWGMVVFVGWGMATGRLPSMGGGY